MNPDTKPIWPWSREYAALVRAVKAELRAVLARERARAAYRKYQKIKKENRNGI